MNIFLDHHHGALYTSLQHTLEKELGHTLYRPIGKEWADSGNWLIAQPYGNNPNTIEQYLGLREIKEYPWSSYAPLNTVKEQRDDYYLIKGDPYDQKAVTFEQFKAMKFDALMATYIDHAPVYKKLIEQYQPQAKLIVQMGNEWPIDWTITNNLLASTLPFQVPQGKNAVFYHQWFDTKLYQYEPHQKDSIFICSFVHTLMSQDLFAQDWKDFLELEKLLPEYIFKSFGAASRDGVLIHQEDIASYMRRSRWGIHEKTGGDGYGHTLHTWAASGRPLLYRGSQYKDRLGGLLLRDMVTGIDLDRHSLDETATIIRNIQETEYQKMCTAMRDTFNAAVNFEEEILIIKQFMENLL